MIRILLCSAVLLAGCDRLSDRDRDAGVAAVERAFDAATSDTAGQTAFTGKGRAIDGDTLSVDFRLFGVDAFERKQSCARDGGCWPCGKLAQDTAAKALRDRTAQIRLNGDITYGRPVATVSVDGKDLGETMIRAGLALPEPRFLREDPKRARRYEAAAEAARAEHKGAHAGEWIQPAQWRRGARLECER